MKGLSDLICQLLDLRMVCKRVTKLDSSSTTCVSKTKKIKYQIIIGQNKNIKPNVKDKISIIK